jgi:biotin carboxylase
MARVLLLATTTGYQTRAFGEAAAALGVELVFATDRCDILDDPWGDGAIAVRFFDEAASVRAVLESASDRPFHGVVAVGDRPTVIAARVARELGLPGHSPEAAAAARDKRLTRERLRAAGLPGPAYMRAHIEDNPRRLAKGLSFPCVIKPTALSASRGVMKVDDEAGFSRAFERLRALLRSPDVRGERSEAHEWILVEAFIDGPEFALEGVLHRGAFTTLAMFDKPDPLDGPFFEETIYVTPSASDERLQRMVASTVAQAASAIGLTHGPVHAECRVHDERVYVLEVAARPIGGLCARALRFEGPVSGASISFEELLLRHALGEDPQAWRRETRASGVMMIPIPARGVYRGVTGVSDAQRVDGVDAVMITAKPDQELIPLPEGASYLGFIFAHGARPGEAERSLRRAHASLRFVVDPHVPMTR